jgi:hypothetical protein
MTYLATMIQTPSGEGSVPGKEFVDDPPTLGRAIARDYFRAFGELDEGVARVMWAVDLSRKKRAEGNRNKS